MIRSAVISDCKDYRYELWRIWDTARPLLVVCMLNPSTADAEKDDPTVRALIHFATAWGYGAICIVNEYAYRSAEPAIMRLAADPVGPDNWRHINRACGHAAESGGKALVAWGNGTDGKLFRKYAKRHELQLVCLGTTQSGAPKHPQARGVHRIPRDQQPIIWEHAA